MSNMSNKTRTYLILCEITNILQDMYLGEYYDFVTLRELLNNMKQSVETTEEEEEDDQ